MQLKIIGGKYRGKRLNLPEDMEDFRPTRTRVREALTSSLMNWIPKAHVLELCAGSGVFSFELISRGAIRATAVEKDSKRASFIEGTIADMNLQGSIVSYNQSVEKYLASIAHSEQFDIIFYDPPYNIDALTLYVEQLFHHIAPYGILVFESATDDTCVNTIPVPSAFAYRKKKYGATTLHYFEKVEE